MSKSAQDALRELDILALNKELNDPLAAFVGSMLKEGVPSPDIIYSDSLLGEWNYGNPTALYDQEKKRIILPEFIQKEGLNSPEGRKVMESIPHELMHYLDDLDVDDIGSNILKRTDKYSSSLFPELREDMTIFAGGKKEKGYDTSMAYYSYGDEISNPMEHLAYYCEAKRGHYPERLMESAAKRIVDEYRPEKITEEEYVVSKGPFPWSKPEMGLSIDIEPEINPEMDITDLVKYVTDRNEALSIYNELKDKYGIQYSAS